MERPTIDDWLSKNLGADLELGFYDDGDKVGHVSTTAASSVPDIIPHDTDGGYGRKDSFDRRTSAWTPY